MLKIDFLRKLGLIVSGGALATAKSTAIAEAASADADSLAGLWEMTVFGKQGTYRYVYAISRGTWVASGDVDDNYQQQKYSPSMGAYARLARGSYKYKERGWVYDLKGNPVGTFTSVGTITLGPEHKTFSGPCTFTQFDLKGKPIFVEPFSAKAMRVTV